MTQAQNYVIIFEAGNKEQAFELAENMSIGQEENRENESTVFIFEDGSAVFTSGLEFRVANTRECFRIARLVERKYSVYL